MPPPRRKKWTEAEERTLIDKYGEMVCDGTLAKMKTRERKYRPIALHVNSMHHVRDPITYPWQWSWKDVSTKVQNMRHQYSLVKQKIKKPDLLVGDSGGEEFDWVEGVTHWCNFLRYKEVFGDVSLVYNNSNDAMMVAAENNENDDMGFDGSGHGMEIVQFGHLDHGEDGDFPAGIDGGENGVMSLEFEYNGEEEGEENYNHDEVDDDNNNNNDSNNIIMNNMKEDGDDGFVYEDVDPTGSHTRKKRKVLKEGSEKRAWGFLVNQVGQLREMETRFEQREAERERERLRKEHLRREIEQECERKREEEGKREREEREKAREMRRERIRELETMEKESEDRERRRRGEELIYEREWEERMNRRRSEWMKRIDNMLSQHQTEMGQIQTRILHEQQNLTSQLLGIVAQWTGHPTGLSDHTGATNHYLSQMMQNIHHVNGIVHEDTRVEGDNQDDQLFVDG